MDEWEKRPGLEVFYPLTDAQKVTAERHERRRFGGMSKADMDRIVAAHTKRQRRYGTT